MKTLKPANDKEQYIAVLTPRHEIGISFNNLQLIMLKTLEFVNEYHPDTEHFTYIYDGVKASSEVVGAVNILQTAMTGYPNKFVSRRKLDLDLDMHGPRARSVWLSEVLQHKPALLLILDDGYDRLFTEAKTLAEQYEIETMIRQVKHVELKPTIR